ncbi:MAG: hypothetical protein Kow00117_21270 [Phototrophicales bacterium]
MVIEIIFAVIFGLLVGGIVNALADDLPLRRSPRLPRYVPDAKKRAIHMPVYDQGGNDISDALIQEDDEKRPLIAWLGITAFLFGKRTSSDGEVKLSWRYPITEIFTVFLMLLCIIGIHAINTDPQTENVDTLQAIYWLIYMGIFSLITVIDIEHKLILFVVIVPSSILAISDALLTSYPPTISEALIGGIAGFMVFFLMYNGGFLFTYIIGALRGEEIKEVAFGYGDVMLATLAGLILGWKVLIFAMFITVFLGAFGALCYLLVKALAGGKYSAFTALPYGPYIIAGIVLMLLFRNEIGPLLFGAVFPS